MDRKVGEYAEGKRFLVYGATGGIGRAIAAEIRAAGGEVVAGGRDGARLAAVAGELGLAARPFVAGLGSLGALEAEFDRVEREGGPVDAVVVAAGYDSRKLLTEQTEAEIAGTTAANLTGLAFLARAAARRFGARGGGALAVVGGFGDGRLAFPRHAIDAATRAGAFTLLEALRREVPGLRTLYFCPPAVSTAAERPWLPLWRALGVCVVSPAAAAAAFLRALARGRRWRMMGSALDRFGTRLNAARPALAERLFLRAMSAKILAYAAGEEGR